MNTHGKISQNRTFFGFILCLYLLASLLFTQEYFGHAIEWKQAPLEKTIRFEADTPFQYRVLAPLVIRAIILTTPIDAYAASTILTVVWTFFSLLAFRILLRTFFSNAGASFGALLLAYAMYWNYAVFGIWRMPFDLPAILLFTLGLFALVRQRWVLFYLAFVLGALNRETILVLSVAFIFLSWKRAEPTFVWKHVGVQLGLWMLIRATLIVIFRNNQGGQFQTQFAANISNLMSGMPTIPLLLSFGGLWLPAFLGWRAVDNRIRRLLLVTIPFAGVMVIVGNLHELRIYNELVPIISMGALGGWLAFYDRVRFGRQQK
jgi:hypothetical protein